MNNLLTYPVQILDYDIQLNSFRIKPAAAYLLSRISTINESTILETPIFKRFSSMKIVPFYRINKTGGGAITLGSNKTKRMVFTENYFSSDLSRYSLNGKGQKSFAYGNDLFAWLKLLAHEVRHLAHIEMFNNNLFYMLFFAGRYLKYRSHDAVPEEVWAEQGAENFNAFYNFVEKKHGIGSIKALFSMDPAKLNETEKINVLHSWHNEFSSY